MNVQQIIVERKRLELEMQNLPKPKVSAYTSEWDINGEIIDYQSLQNVNLSISFKCYEWDNDELFIECDGIKYLSYFLLVSNPEYVRLGILEAPINLNNIDKFLIFCSRNYKNIETHKEGEKLWALLDTFQQCNFELVKQLLKNINHEQ